jgi:hypothetical protein
MAKGSTGETLSSIRVSSTSWWTVYVMKGGDEPVAIAAALQGAGGLGKTTLAQAVCHDDLLIST